METGSKKIGRFEFSPYVVVVVVVGLPKEQKVTSNNRKVRNNKSSNSRDSIIQLYLGTSG